MARARSFLAGVLGDSIRSQEDDASEAPVNIAVPADEPNMGVPKTSCSLSASPVSTESPLRCLASTELSSDLVAAPTGSVDPVAPVPLVSADREPGEKSSGTWCTRQSSWSSAVLSHTAGKEAAGSSGGDDGGVAAIDEGVVATSCSRQVVLPFLQASEAGGESRGAKRCAPRCARDGESSSCAFSVVPVNAQQAWEGEHKVAGKARSFSC